LRRYDRLFIGGAWVESHSRREIESVDPSTGDVWAVVPEADEVDIDRAVSAARSAFEGVWQKDLTATARGALIHRLGELLDRDAPRLAELESRDNGKPLADTIGEIRRAAQWLYFFAGAADKIYGETIPYSPNAHAYTRREPVGVVGAILPWNSPISLYSWKLGPALAAGNTVVLKPAELTPVSAMEVARLVEEAGFPPGVINIVPGYGHIAGSALTIHRAVNKISFTGAHTTAQAIMKAASVNLKRLSLECGGKSPHIVFADADLDQAMVVATHGAFRSTGQSCSLGSRLFLERPIYDRFLAKLVDRVRCIRIGMPLEKDTHIGPQTSAQQLAKTERYIRIGIDEGAKLVLGGKRPPDPKFGKGYFIEPTIFSEVDNSSRLAQEEIFGPVLAVIPFDTEEEVVNMANDVDYGLVAGLWTSDIKRAHRVVNQIKAGLVSVNTYRPVHWMLPYGGYKLSGIGRENGTEALKYYTETKTVVFDHSSTPPADPFADG